MIQEQRFCAQKNGTLTLGEHILWTTEIPLPLTEAPHPQRSSAKSPQAVQSTTELSVSL